VRRIAEGVTGDPTLNDQIADAAEKARQREQGE
jgi:hypothetical protein